MLLSKFKSHDFWLIAPNTSKIWLLFPLLYTLFIQILTGIPKPSILLERSADEMLLQFAEEIFDYPYWMQDLSHFPLFFLFAWLWCWFFQRQKGGRLSTVYIPIFLSLSFAIFNELAQFLIPQRFPSFGDVVMNLLGVISALILHDKALKKQSDTVD
jgi:VanZ family protein